jgi:hypothetical protein
MPSTRFDFAPLPAPIGEGLAVPIDIQSVSACLRFCPQVGSTLEAEVEFVTGPINGFPTFDLRQPIRSAMLDGVPLPADRLGFRDLGGGDRAEMRVIERSLAPSTSHTLSLVSNLGTPLVPMERNRLPALEWKSNERLTFRFGFTDTRPGRYLESWIPSNLIFDEFTLRLEIAVEHTSVPHVLITNGKVESEAANRWVVWFPETTSSFCPMLEIHPADRVEVARRPVPLPVSNRDIELEVWKEEDVSTDLALALDVIGAALAEFEEQVGPYPHGDRYVALLIRQPDGMEYAGGTVTSFDLIRHEIFHSWWGRGLRPSDQASSWWDEGWTTAIVDRGSDQPETVRSDFSQPPGPLHRPHPWSRTTVGTANRLGGLLFRQIAHYSGAERLREIMKELYRSSFGTPLTTYALEEFLLQRIPTPEVVDLFHRYVFSLDDPAEPPRLPFVGEKGSTTSGEETSPWLSDALWFQTTVNGLPVGAPSHDGEGNEVAVRLRNDGAEVVPHSALLVSLDAEVAFVPRRTPGVASDGRHGRPPRLAGR